MLITYRHLLLRSANPVASTPPKSNLSTARFLGTNALLPLAERSLCVVWIWVIWLKSLYRHGKGNDSLTRAWNRWVWFMTSVSHQQRKWTSDDEGGGLRLHHGALEQVLERQSPCCVGHSFNAARFFINRVRARKTTWEGDRLMYHSMQFKIHWTVKR